MQSTLTPRIPFRRLYCEELRALPRGSFVLGGSALLVALLTAIAAVPGVFVTGGLWGFGFAAFAVVPSAFAVVGAARIAGARSSLFVHAVFTMPVQKRDYLLAHLACLLTVGVLYLLAMLPLVAVVEFHLGAPSVLPAFLGVGLALVVVASVLGVTLGLLFPRRGVGPAATAAAVAAAAAVGAFIHLGMLLADGISGIQEGSLLGLLHASPIVLLVAGADLLPFGVSAASSASQWAAAGALLGGVAAVGAWIYWRQQGVEGWESKPALRLLAFGLLTAALVAPAVVAEPAYVAGGPDLGGSVRTSMNGMLATLVPRGQDAQSAEFGGGRGRLAHLDVGRQHEVDLLLVFQVAHHARLQDLQVSIAADPRLSVAGRTEWSLEHMPDHERRHFPGHQGPPPVEPYALPVLRVPLALTPTRPNALAQDVYEVRVNATLLAVSHDDAVEPRRLHASALLPVLADVEQAPLHLTLAGLPGTLACAAGAAVRWTRTR